MQVQPYLFFDGRCEEAVEFYRSALCAEVVMLMRYKDSPDPPPPGMVPPGGENKVMHAAGIRRPLFGAAELSGFCAVADCGQRSRGRSAVRFARRGRAGADAVGQNLFLATFRHGRRPLWGVVDGLCRVVRTAGACAGVSEKIPVDMSNQTGPRRCGL
jgi:hypothetical protein